MPKIGDTVPLSSLSDVKVGQTIPLSHLSAPATASPAESPPATPPKSIFQHLLDGGTTVANALGLGDAVDTIGSNLATLAHPVLASKGYIPQPSLLQNRSAGAQIGINTAGLEFGGPIAAEKAGALAAQKVAAKNAAAVLDTVAPKLTAKEAADALATRGGTKTGLLGTIKPNLSPSVLKIADAVTELVPEFNPSKSLVENINVTKDAVGRLAADLKDKVVAAGQDRIFPLKELGAALNAVPKPTLLVGDLDKVYGRVIDKAMEIARSNGGKVSDLLDARKEFDQFVSREFPNLYSSDTLTPMRSAIKGIRNAITDFTAEHLPDDVNIRESLTHQSRLLEAVENMSEKAASGAQKEIGTNAIERAAAKYPKLKKAVIGGAAAIGADKVIKDVTGIGL